MSQGKYDTEAEALSGQYAADVSVVIILGGSKGSGFSVAAADLALVRALPDVLRRLANDIDKRIRAGQYKVIRRGQA